MKNFYTRTFINTVILGLGMMANAHAHTYSGDLGQAAEATDRFQVNCGSKGVELFASILDMSAKDNVILKVKVGKKPPLLESADADDGGNANASAGMTKADGGGVYALEVGKDGVGKQHYQLIYHCQNKSHIHSATPALTAKQNQ